MGVSFFLLYGHGRLPTVRSVNWGRCGDRRNSLAAGIDAGNWVDDSGEKSGEIVGKFGSDMQEG